MGKKFLLIIIVFILFFTGGCWDRLEVEERIPIINIAIDKSKQKNLYIFSAATPNISLLPGGLNPNPREAKPGIISAEAQNMSKALELLQNKLSRQVFLGYLQTIIISEDIAKEKGIEGVLDFFRRSPRVRPLTLLVITKGKALDSLETAPLEAPIPVLYIPRMLQMEYDLQWIPSTFLKDFNIAYANRGVEPVLVYCKVEEKRFQISGVAVFKKDKMIGELTNEELSDYLRLKGKVGRFIEIPCPLHPQETIVFSPTSVQRDIDLVNDKGILVCKINLKIIGEINELGKYPHKGKEDLVLNKLEKNIEERSIKLIKKLQEEFKSDIIGIGLYVKAFYPEYWKTINWDEVFSELDIKVDVNLIITDLKGLTQ